MATISTLVSGVSSTYGGYGSSEVKPTIIDQILDFANIAHSAGDIIDAITVRKGEVVLASGVEVITGDTAGNSGTIVLKLGSTARGSATAPTATGYTAGLFSGTAGQATADSTLNLVTATGTTNGVYRVWAVIAPADRGTRSKVKLSNGAAVYTAV